MLANRFLEIAVCAVAIIYVTSTPTPSPFQYGCREGKGGNVEITINRANNNLVNGTLSSTNISLCNATFRADEYVLKDCPANKIIEVKVEKYGKDGVVSKRHVQHYELQCNVHILPTKIVVTASQLAIQPLSTYVTKVPPTQTIDRTIAPSASEFHMTVNPSVGIKIGDPLNIIISTTGLFPFSPEKCIAIGNSSNHTIWDVTCTEVDEELFTGVWSNNSATSISHSLSAFRFKDSDTVTLMCVLKVCGQNNRNECPIKKSCPSQPGQSGRRRRQAYERENAVVQATFKVTDSGQMIPYPSSGSGTITPGLVLASVALLVSAVHH